MKIFSGKDKKSQKNLAIIGGVFFAMPAAATVVDASGLLTADGVPEDVLLGTLVAALLMSSLAGGMIYYGLTDRKKKDGGDGLPLST